MTAQPVQNVRSRQEWAEIINADWRRSIQGIVQTGRDIKAAQSELPHGEFEAMVRNDLDFGPTMAFNLKKIADHPRISDLDHGADLPPRWTTLRLLSQLSIDDWDWAKEHGLITAQTSKKGARALVDAVSSRDTDEAPVGSTRKSTELPSPAEARQIARETGRMVSASDGNLYSGTTEEEDADYLSRREQTYGVMDAIKTLADVGVTPGDWLEQSKPHWLNRFDVGDLERAVAWLEQLRTDYFQREGIVDHAQ